MFKHVATNVVKLCCSKGCDAVLKRQLANASIALVKVTDEIQHDAPHGTCSVKTNKNNKYNTQVVISEITPSKIAFNLEGLNSELQETLITGYLPELTKLLDEGDCEKITFNNLCESVYRYCINMQIRRHGYTSTFKRYNHDKGMAIFELIKDHTY